MWLPPLSCPISATYSDLITLLSARVLFFLNFCGTSIYFPPICRTYHRHLRSFGFRDCAQTQSACCRDARQTSSPGKYGGFIFFFFFRYSQGIWTSVSFLLGWLRRNWNRCILGCRYVCLTGGIFKRRRTWQQNVLCRCFFVLLVCL